MRLNCRSTLFVLVVILSGALVGGCLSLDGPQARIEVTPLSGVVPLVIHFDGTGSTASTGISTYTWDFGTDDPASHEASGTYTYTHAGTFPLTLTVRAASGSTDQKTVMVEVEPAVWITDANLNMVYKLDMQGTELDHFDLPVTEPHGITIAEAGGESCSLSPVTTVGTSVSFVSTDHREYHSELQRPGTIAAQSHLWGDRAEAALARRWAEPEDLPSQSNRLSGLRLLWPVVL